MSIPNNKAKKRQLWTAVAHVKPNPGNDMLNGAPAAFVAAIVLATDARDVFSKVKKKVNSYEFMLGRIEDIEPIIQPPEHTASPELLKLGDTLTSENPVAFGNFHSYKDSP